MRAIGLGLSSAVCLRCLLHLLFYPSIALCLARAPHHAVHFSQFPHEHVHMQILHPGSWQLPQGRLCWAGLSSPLCLPWRAESRRGECDLPLPGGDGGVDLALDMPTSPAIPLTSVVSSVLSRTAANSRWSAAICCWTGAIASATACAIIAARSVACGFWSSSSEPRFFPVSTITASTVAVGAP